MTADTNPKIEIAGSAVLGLGRQASRSTFVFGMLLICLGIFAVMAPLFTGVATAVLAGLMLLSAGVIETLFAFRAPSFGRGALTFLFGGLGVAAGLLVLGWPGEGLGALTILLASYFIGAGAVDAMLAFKLRPAEGWGWALFSGILSAALGLFIVAQWPMSGVWAVGIYVGVRLLMHGCLMMALGVTGRDTLEYLQDSRLESLEGHLRAGISALQEVQVVLVAQTAMLISLGNEVRNKVSADSVDPAIGELNSLLGDAREAMQQAEAAGSEAWDAAQKEANVSFQKLRGRAQEAAGKLQKDLGIEFG
jgi:uncharacterized membrane protein HdeD (DUF308 family)